MQVHLPLKVAESAERVLHTYLHQSLLKMTWDLNRWASSRKPPFVICCPAGSTPPSPASTPPVFIFPPRARQMGVFWNKSVSIYHIIY